jgi:predicted phage terminase large subunit-like protein
MPSAAAAAEWSVDAGHEALSLLREYSLDELEAELARRRFLPYVRRMFPLYRPAAHHGLLADALEAVERGDFRFLVVTMPPRHGKSEQVSVHFPAWFLGRNPSARVIGASYSGALANRFSRRARNQLQAPAWPFPHRTSGDLAQVVAWDLESPWRGGYVSAGVGGSITGMGADLLIVDDPVKDAAEAESETMRENTWEWFTSTAFTRLHPGGAVVVVATRWHHDDLVGRLLAAEDGAKWRVVDMPALAGPGDPLGRAEGEALWPERYPASELERIRVQIGSRHFEALYQQRPSDERGNILRRDWWRWHDPALLPADVSWVLQSWDTAFKKGRENDWSVCLTAAAGHGGFYALDLWRGKVSFPELERQVRLQYAKWRPDEVIVEDAASGQSLLQVLNHGLAASARPDSNAGTGSGAWVPVVPVRVEGDKVAMANAASPWLEAGLWSLPEGAEWAGGLVEECARFPFGADDDQVDAFSQATMRLARRAWAGEWVADVAARMRA